MQITEIHVKKRASYEDKAGEIITTVSLEGPEGRQEIVLSAATTAQIFKVIKHNLIQRSKRQSDMTEEAVDDAIATKMLDENTLLIGPNADAL